MRYFVKSRSVALVCAMGLALGAGACAGDDRPDAVEDRDPVAMSDTPTQDPAVGAAQTTRVTGCLQRGDIDGTFVLAQARTEGEAGSVGTSGETSGADTYSLVHTGDTDLTNYVGSRVAVTGRFQSAGATTMADPQPEHGAEARDSGLTAGSGAPTPAPRDDLGAETTGGMTSAARSSQIIVEQVERVDGECQAG